VDVRRSYAVFAGVGGEGITVNSHLNFDKMEDNFKKFKHYKFNHDIGEEGCGEVDQALGLSEEFCDNVIKTLLVEEIKQEKVTETWQETFNQILPNNAMEAFFIGWSARALYDLKNGGGNNLMEMLMRVMRDR